MAIKDTEGASLPQAPATHGNSQWSLRRKAPSIAPMGRPLGKSRMAQALGLFGPPRPPRSDGCRLIGFDECVHIDPPLLT